MSQTIQLEIARRWYLEVLSGPANSDLGTLVRYSDQTAWTIEQLFSADYVNHVTPAPPNGWKPGVAGARQVLKIYRSAFPDLKIKIHEQSVEGNKVTTRYRVSGTHSGGDFFGKKASGMHYRVSGLGIDLIENGKFVESWGSWDVDSLIAQMHVSQQTTSIPD